MQMKDKLCKESLIKIGKGAAIAGGGAFTIVALQGIMDLDLGAYTEISVAMGGIIINAIREYLKGN